MMARAVAVALIALFIAMPACAGNMLTRGDFESPGSAPPDGWRFIVNSDPNAEGQGTITIVPDADAPSGRHVAMIDKTDYPGYRPTLSTIDFAVEPGATYQFSAVVKADHPFYAGLTTAGAQPHDPNQTRFMREAQRRYPASPTYRRIVARYHVDPRARTGSISFYYNKRQGRMWIDDVRLERVEGLAQPIETVEQPDAIHNLVELSVRSPFKPFWHLARDDGWTRNDRTVFRDTGTGATIWKMSRHPDDMCRHQYQDIPPWNCNGQRMSLFALDAWRQIFMRPDGTKLGYVSNMLGWIDFYNLIARLPDAPRDVHVDGNRIVWQKPINARETARYRIYHASAMTGPFAFVGSVDSERLSFTPAQQDGCFVVTAEEYSGLESNYASPTWFGDRPGQLALAMETEAGDYVEPATEVFDPAASNLYALSLGDREPSDGVTLSAEPQSDVQIFARVRSILRSGPARVRLHVDGQPKPQVAIRGRDWHWVNLSGEGAHAIEQTLSLVPLTAGVVVDQLMVVDRPAAVPDMFWGATTLPPAR